MDTRLLAVLLQAQTATLAETLDGTNSGNDTDGLGNLSFGSLFNTLLQESNNEEGNLSEDSSASVLPSIGQSLNPLIMRDQISLRPGQSLSEASITPRINQLIDSIAKQHGIEPALVKGLIQQESAFNPYAVSSAGAAGLMQLMPETATQLGVANVFDPVENIQAGVRYLKELLVKYSGNESLALAAYNAGAGNVDKYGGIPPFAETRQYVKNVEAFAQTFRSE